MLLTINFFIPELEATIKSPLPELSTTSPAKEGFAEIETMGEVPVKADAPVTLNNAEVEDVPPINKSSVMLAGEIAPLFLCQKPSRVAVVGKIKLLA